MYRIKFVLPVIVIAQFFCTSIWFAGNSVISDIAKDLALAPQFLAHITSAIQFGFITGTLVFAIFTLSDRFSPSAVFFVSAVVASLFNLATTLPVVGSAQLLLFRFFAGFFLAGIYPVGMKIASDHYRAGLGKSLGFLVGALVLGTAFPHLLKNLTVNFQWEYVIYATSSLSFLGGCLMLVFVPDGQHRKHSQKLSFTAFLKGFNRPDFRAASFGYFGHMWELYTFWVFVPFMLKAYTLQYTTAQFNIPLLSFLIIASGGAACVASGILSHYFGARRIAGGALLLSGLCCLASPFFFAAPPAVFICFLFFWAIVVVADSPLFSTIVAQHAPEESRGTSLTIVTCIGFSITIVSIQLINLLSGVIVHRYIYMLLAIGPVLGLAALARKGKVSTP